ERGCQLYLAQVTKKELKEKHLEDVSVIHDFPEVFPDDLPGLLAPRKVEFKIKLVPRVAHVARAPYRLAPSEMQELVDQLQDLSEKGFIRPSSSPWGAPVLFVKKKDESFRLAVSIPTKLIISLWASVLGMTSVSTLIAGLNQLAICTSNYYLSFIIPCPMPDLPTFVILGRTLTKMKNSIAVALQSWSSLINSHILGSSHCPGIPMPLVVVLVVAGVVSIIAPIVVMVVPVTTLRVFPSSFVSDMKGIQLKLDKSEQNRIKTGQKREAFFIISSIAVQTPGSGISNLLAVGTTFTGSGNLYYQWELSPGSRNALCMLFPTILP
nr:putative reverse transcriptase domain-containing protein [Tanacetum cinerariifolium]